MLYHPSAGYYTPLPDPPANLPTIGKTSNESIPLVIAAIVNTRHFGRMAQKCSIRKVSSTENCVLMKNPEPGYLSEPPKPNCSKILPNLKLHPKFKIQNVDQFSS